MRQEESVHRNWGQLVFAGLDLSTRQHSCLGRDDNGRRVGCRSKYNYALCIMNYALVLIGGFAYDKIEKRAPGDLQCAAGAGVCAPVHPGHDP